MQAKHVSKTHLICIACKAIAVLWCDGCAMLPPKVKSSRKISWRRCNLIISASADTEGIAERGHDWRNKVHKLNPGGGRGPGRHKKPGQNWSSELPSAMSKWDPPTFPIAKLGVVKCKLSGAVRLGLPPHQGTVHKCAYMCIIYGTCIPFLICSYPQYDFNGVNVINDWWISIHQELFV